MIDIEGPVREYPGNLFNDYLQSVSAQLQGPVMIGRDLKRKR